MQNSANASAGVSLVWDWKNKRYSVPLTQADMYKLAQAVEFEGYPREGVAWALLQRFAWVRMRGIKTTLAKLVEDYAQPINPDWFSNGARHVAEVERLERLGDYQGARLEKAKALNREKKAQTPWEQFRPEVKRLIASLMRGDLVSPVVGAIHYWASRADDFAGNQAKKPNLVLLDRGYGFGPGRNVFFGAKGAEDFVAYLVPDGQNLLSKADKAAKTFLGVALVGYFLYRWTVA